MPNWIHDIKHKLETILEKPTTFENARSEFRVLSDEKLAEAFRDLKPNHTTQTQILFSRLAPFYHSGVLLKNKNNLWDVHGAFQEGVFFPLPSTVSESPTMLPPIQVGQIKKTETAAILKKLKLNDFLPANKDSGFYSTLVFRPQQDYIFILFSEAPDLWLKNLAEKTQKEILTRTIITT
jgi:hypothetical protein